MVLRRLILLAMICMLTGCGSRAGRHPGAQPRKGRILRGESGGKGMGGRQRTQIPRGRTAFLQ